MATIIEDYVGNTEFVNEVLKEFGIGLVTYPNVNSWRLEFGAPIVDVDTNDGCVRPKVALPHFQ